MHWLDTGERRADPSLDEQYRVIVEHYEAMLSLYGHDTGVNLARKHLGWYTKGLPGSAEFRNRVNQEPDGRMVLRSEEHTSELQSLMRISYAVFCLKKKKKKKNTPIHTKKTMTNLYKKVTT